MSSKRSAVTHVYWTQEEKKLVELHAKRVGVPLAVYLRSLALAEVAKTNDADAPERAGKK
jgi:hypothetical protein